MRTLFLLRHAKAENAAPGSPDPDRALNERGRQAAQTMGKYVKKKNLTFDLVLCSTALRARETAESLLAAAEMVVTVDYDQRIYEASPGQLLEVISEVKDELRNVLLVGHNPGMEELIRTLTDELEQISPCTLAKIDYDGREWSRVAENKGKLEWIVRPKDLVED